MAKTIVSDIIVPSTIRDHLDFGLTLGRRWAIFTP